MTCSRHIAQLYFYQLAKRSHTTVQRRTSKCSAGLIQNSGNHRWAHGASKQPTYASAYTKPRLHAHCSQSAQCARAWCPGEGGREGERARKKQTPKLCKCAYQTPVASASLAMSAVRAHSAGRHISFACICALQEPKRWVHASMIQHAQVSELAVSCSCTRQHTTARSCRVPLYLPQ